MEVYIPSSKLIWQWTSTFSKRKCIFKWWIAMLVYRRVSKTHLFMHSSASTVGFVAQTRKAWNSESVKHPQFKDNTSNIRYVRLHDQWRWMIDVYNDISNIEKMKSKDPWNEKIIYVTNFTIIAMFPLGVFSMILARQEPWNKLQNPET